MFPSTLSTFPRPATTDRLNSPSHSALHNQVSSALGQVEATIGVEGNSSVVGSLMFNVRSPASDGGGHVQTAIRGGTGQTTYTKGDILVAQSSSVLSKLSVGTTGQVLAVDSSQAVGINWISSGSSVFAPFGDGSDGIVILDGTNTYSFFTKVSNTYTLTQNILCSSLTINSGITLIENGYAIYSVNSIVNAGTIHNNGANAANAVQSQAAPGGAGGGGATFTAGTTGGAGGSTTGSAGAAKTCLGSSGVAGGNGTADVGGGGGTATAETVLMKGLLNPTGNITAGVELVVTELYRYIASTNAEKLSASAGSGGGGGGGGGGNFNNGGGAGGSGGVVFLAAPTITNTGNIYSLGGNGGNGLTNGGGAYSGGGGGGTGGTIFLIYKTLTAGTISVAGGTGGTKGGGAATDGTVGGTGKIYKAKITDTVIA